MLLAYVGKKHTEGELHLELSLFLDAWSGLGNQGMVVWV